MALEKLKRGIRASKNAVTSTANEALTKIQKAAKESTQYFYDTYDPTYYDRLYDINNAYIPVDFKFGSGRTVGVIFSSGHMQMAHNASNDFIFENSWVGGRHGNPAWPSTAVTSPSPKSKMDTDFQRICAEIGASFANNIAAQLHRYF